MYAVAMEDGGWFCAYAGDTISNGMTIPTFTDDFDDAMEYDDIDDAMAQRDRLSNIFMLANPRVVEVL